MSQMMQVTEIELLLQQIYAVQAVGRREWDQLSVTRPEMMDAVVVRLVRTLAAYQAEPPDGVLTVPASWWDFLKQTIQGRFPRIKFKTIRTQGYTALAYLPEVPLPARLTGGRFTIWRHDGLQEVAEEGSRVSAR